MRSAAIEVARVLQDSGHRCWVVGGAVRDLALGLSPKDVDLASGGTPAELERLFDRTHAVGRAFGTLIVSIGAVDLQHTTFRTESSYSDARRPDRVEYGSTPEEDARRRDFTCNAIFLDPLSDELFDPERGLADLAAGVLRCVGDAGDRFREDGLRLLRMARLAAHYGLAPGEGLLEAARGAAAALHGVSPERVRTELERVFTAPEHARALELLVEAELLEAALRERREDALAPAARRVEIARRLPPAPGVALGLAATCAPAQRAQASGALRVLATLRPSNGVRRRVEAIWAADVRLWDLVRGSATGARAERAERVRLVREPEWPEALRYARARSGAAGEDARPLLELEAFAATLSAADRFPEPLLRSADLARAGIERGPRWSELLEAAETAQLEGELTSRDQALAWLEARGTG